MAPRKRAPHKKTTDGPLPLPMRQGRLAVSRMMVMAPAEAVLHMMEGAKTSSLSRDQIATIVKRYREGHSYLAISHELGVSKDQVRLWVIRAEELHILHIRRGGNSERAEKAELASIKRTESSLDKQEAALNADAALSVRIAEKVKQIVEAITPEKISAAKLKDLSGAACQLIEKQRLLVNKSTSNTSTQSIVKYITQLNTLSMAEKMKLVAERRAELPPPADVEQDEIPDFLRMDDDDDTED